MSSEEDISDNKGSGPSQAIDAGESKKRKVLRACDVCRRKKIRCDAHSQPGNRCSHCTTFNLDCTFVESAKKRGPPKGYVEDLEKRVMLLENLIRQVAPQVNVDDEVGPNFTRDSWIIDRAGQTRRPSRSTVSTAPLRVSSSPTLAGTSGLASILRPLGPTHFSSLSHSAQDALGQRELEGNESSGDEGNFPKDDGSLSKHLQAGMRRLELGEFERRFHGKSSGVMLVQAARTLKQEITGDPSVSPMTAVSERRLKFWRPSPWEWMSTQHSHDWIGTLRFPPRDLANSLVEIYFRQFQTYYPVLHRPAFEEQVRQEAYKSDVLFASTYLLVCAIGARWSNDPRVCINSGDNDDVEWNSAGWPFFAQVLALRRPYLQPPTLQDLQLSALFSFFLLGTSAPHAAWLVAGIGLRFAQDVGAHRRKVYGTSHPFENNMWKRAFWCLVALDKISSAALGRPAAVQDEDIDADLPSEVDDEYWNPELKEWKQPEGKAPRMAFFTVYLKLLQILGFAIRTIYSINKSKIHMGFVGHEWEQHTVSELDSTLNSWIDELPSHLRWDPNIEDPIYFEQSALLHITYYHVQVLIHRPFIPGSPKKQSPLSFPSLAICTNAARSASRIIDIQRQRGCAVTPTHLVSAFTSGIVLLISIWGMKKSGGHVDVAAHISDVHKCMQFLQFAEVRWHTAGRLWDILRELAQVGELPMPEPNPPDSTHRKRERESDDNEESNRPDKNPTQSQSPDFPRRTESISEVPGMLQGSSVRISGSQPSIRPSGLREWSSQSHFTQPQASDSQEPIAAAGASSLFDVSSWGTYHIAGGAIPGINADYQTAFSNYPLSQTGLGESLLGGIPSTSYMEEIFGPFPASLGSESISEPNIAIGNGEGQSTSTSTLWNPDDWNLYGLNLGQYPSS
ncbi:hypothetical protein FRC03_008980 [Tulasnella sp. 419]|nr:hypothetical protein FRC02_005689 [Tulasnella sp. 418]KAG8967959.1 hypothetical protein FRC03_008980 [Tulasnella sp. 419]